MMQKMKSYWHKFKLWRRKDPRIHSFVACVLGLGLFFLISILITCWCWNAFSKLFGRDYNNARLVASMISGILASMGTVLFAEPCWQWLKSHWGEYFKPWWQKNRLTNSFITFACALILLLLITMLTCKGGIFTALLGTVNKKDTIEFIALGIGGTLGVIGAIALSFRADAQVENNKLIEKGRIDERFKSATENLVSERPAARIAAFYQFYYLAKDSQDDNVRRNTFGILCAHLRTMPEDQSHIKRDNGYIFPTKEYKTLLNVLFNPDDEPVFGELHANLQNVNFTHTNLKNANLANADLCDATLKGANFTGANLADSKFMRANAERAYFIHANLERANFDSAMLIYAAFIGADLKEANLAEANLEQAKLVKANLTSATMTHIKMVEATLDQANIKNANLTGTSLDNASLVAAHLENANLTGVGFDCANLTNANLTNANLDHTYFANADLTNANLTSARFMIADFTNTKLRNVNFANTDLLHTNFYAAESIEGADFRRAKMGNRPIMKSDIPADKGEYYAEWNPPPKKEEN